MPVQHPGPDRRRSIGVNIALNGQPYTVPDGTTIAGLLAALGLRLEQVAVECNLNLVPRGQLALR